MKDSLFLRDWNIICLTETKLKNRRYSKISNYSEGWKDIHETVGYSLAICFKKVLKVLKESEPQKPKNFQKKFRKCSAPNA